MRIVSNGSGLNRGLKEATIILIGIAIAYGDRFFFIPWNV